jgi:hypothetical protein
VPIIQGSVNTKSFLPHNKSIVTLKEVHHLLESPDYTTSEQSEMLQLLRGKLFWIWDKANHREKEITYRGDCCFTDIIGRPRKPFFDYQKMLYIALFRPGYVNSNAVDTDSVLYSVKEKHLWVKKATGLGFTELMLRFMAWLC